MKHTTLAIIERGKDGTYAVFTPNLKGTIVGEGNTIEAAKADFIDAYHETVQSYQEDRQLVPEELQDVAFEYLYHPSVLFELFPFINLTEFAKQAGINASLLRHYKSDDTYISTEQMQRIQSALRHIGEVICSTLPAISNPSL